MTTPPDTRHHGLRPETQRERYERLGPTGFLHPVHVWAVLIGSRVVDKGVNAREARRTFKRWSKFADGSQGHAAGQTVILTKDGQIFQTHKPTNINVQL